MAPPASTPRLDGVTVALQMADGTAAGAVGAVLRQLGASVILMRQAMAFFYVPHLALGGELSPHYTERSKVMAEPAGDRLIRPVRPFTHSPVHRSNG